MAKYGRRPRYPPEDRIEKSAVTLKTDIYLDDDLGESVVNLDDDDIFKLVRIEPEPAKNLSVWGVSWQIYQSQAPHSLFPQEILAPDPRLIYGKHNRRH